MISRSKFEFDLPNEQGNLKHNRNTIVIQKGLQDSDIILVTLVVRDMGVAI
jgi:hypothetical protein